MWRIIAVVLKDHGTHVHDFRDLEALKINVMYLQDVRNHLTSGTSLHCGHESRITLLCRPHDLYLVVAAQSIQMRVENILTVLVRLQTCMSLVLCPHIIELVEAYATVYSPYPIKM
jgi:hypothetical protein